MGLWVPVAAYIGFIFWISSSARPVPGIEQFPWMDKPFHAAEYAPLGMLLLRALTRSFRANDARWGRWHLWAVAGGTAVGLLDEWHQYFIPLKSSSPWDVLADGAGVALGQWLYAFKFKSARRP